ncbi:MAG: hypothetical protein Q9162_002721 [Coniocarpon cinnabarinum]
MPESESVSQHRSSQPGGGRTGDASVGWCFEFKPCYKADRSRGLLNSELGFLDDLIPHSSESKYTGRRGENANPKSFRFAPQWEGDRFKGFHNEELGFLHDLTPHNLDHPFHFGKKIKGKDKAEYYHHHPEIHGPWFVKLYEKSKLLQHPESGKWLHDHIRDHFGSSRTPSEDDGRHSSPEQSSGEDSSGHSSDEPHERGKGGRQAQRSNTGAINKAMAKMHLSGRSQGADEGQPGSSKGKKRPYAEQAEVLHRIQQGKLSNAPLMQQGTPERRKRKKLSAVERFAKAIRAELRQDETYGGFPAIDELEEATLKPRSPKEEKGQLVKQPDEVVPLPWSAIKEAMKRLLNKDELGAAKEMIQDCDTEFEDRHGESAIDGKK